MSLQSQAELLYMRGIDANMAGETDLALRLFLASHALVPAEPRFVLSAANMMLKLADPEVQHH